jgi:dTDP-4-dehydrorhamnose reductase
MTQEKKVLVLGAAGMLGNAVLRFLTDTRCYAVVGSVRSDASCRLMPERLRAQVVTGIDVLNGDILASLFAAVRPDAVVNCVGIVKQLTEADDPLVAIPINSLLPHRLARLCAAGGARLIHVSTDCVFSGSKGMYTEDDPSDATDLYGRSKYLGEVDYPNAVTLRTSIIGHELTGAHGLVQWFLSQRGTVRGFTKAVFSGLPTVELASVIHQFVLPDDGLHGVYHVSAMPIDKCTLLGLVAEEYKHAIDVVPDGNVVIDRSLDSSRFRSVTGYAPAPWHELIARMREFG